MFGHWVCLPSFPMRGFGVQRRLHRMILDMLLPACLKHYHVSMDHGYRSFVWEDPKKICSYAHRHRRCKSIQNVTQGEPRPFMKSAPSGHPVSLLFFFAFKTPQPVFSREDWPGRFNEPLSSYRLCYSLSRRPQLGKKRCRRAERQVFRSNAYLSRFAMTSWPS